MLGGVAQRRRGWCLHGCFCAVLREIAEFLNGFRGSLGHGSVGGLSSKGCLSWHFLKAYASLIQATVGSGVCAPWEEPWDHYIAVCKASHGALAWYVAVVARRRGC